MSKAPCKIGHRFGDWKIVSDTWQLKRYDNRMSMVKAKCKCGFIGDVILSLLKSGRSKMCGRCSRKMGRNVNAIKKIYTKPQATISRESGVCHSDGECVDYGMCGDRMFQCACGGHIKPRNGHENFRGDAY